MNVQIRPANLSDISLIHQLAQKIWRAYYPPIIGNDQVEYMLNKGYSYDSLQEQMKEQSFFMIENNEQSVGFAAISKKSEGYFIHKFYLDESMHGKGFGTTAFEHLISFYGHDKTYFLQVNRGNIKAINFYFKMGMIIDKMADFDIGDGYFMNDFIMIKKGKPQ